MSVGLDVLRDTMQSVRDWWWGGGDQVPVISLFEMLQPAKLGKTDCHHQNKRYEGGGDLASAKQLVYCTALYEGGGTSPVQSSLCTLYVSAISRSRAAHSAQDVHLNFHTAHEL